MEGFAMVIAFDIDQTITRHPGFFACISRALVRDGHEVVIITFREDRASTEADLREWGIEYTRLVTSELGSVLRHGVERWKGAVCREHGVEVFFEDDAEVLRHVDQGVFTLLAVDHEQHDLGRTVRRDREAVV
jgi:hypothetical protein